jgi:preprotein translocase subunit SecE
MFASGQFDLRDVVRKIIFMSKITEYLKETKTELKHVIWPTRGQTILYTLIVIVLSVLIAYFLGIFDFLFSRGLEKLISL